MNRRTFLASIGVTSLVILIGCLESIDSLGNSDDGNENEVKGNEDSSNPSEKRDKWHLCEDVATEPSLEFESSQATGGVEFNDGMTHGTTARSSPGNIHVILVTDESELEEHEITADHVIDFIDDTNFEAQALLAIQYGITGSSNTPRFMRIEETGNGIHGFGCIGDPHDPTMDATATTSIARFDQPEGALETAKATIVTSHGEVTVSADDGVVNIEE